MDSQTIETRLKATLADVVANSELSSPEAADAATADPNVEFSEMGVSSVDLMDFVIRVEREFDVVLLDDMAPDELPLNIAGWRDLLVRRLPAS